MERIGFLVGGEGWEFDFEGCGGHAKLELPTKRWPLEKFGREACLWECWPGKEVASTLRSLLQKGITIFLRFFNLHTRLPLPHPTPDPGLRVSFPRIKKS